MLHGELIRLERSSAWTSFVRALALLGASDVLLYFYLHAAGLAPTGVHVSGFFVPLVLVRWVPYVAAALLMRPARMKRYLWAVGVAELAAVLCVIAAHLGVTSLWPVLPATLVLMLMSKSRRSTITYALISSLGTVLVGTGLLTFTEAGVVGTALLIPHVATSLAHATRTVTLRLPRGTRWILVLAASVGLIATAVVTKHVPATASLVLVVSTLGTLLSLQPRHEQGVLVQASVPVVTAFAAYQLSNGLALSILALGATMLLPHTLSERAARVAYLPSLVAASLVALALGAYAAVPALDLRSLMRW